MRRPATVERRLGSRDELLEQAAEASRAQGAVRGATVAPPGAMR